MQNEIIAEEVSEIALDDPTIEVQPAVVEMLGNELVYAQNSIARKMIEEVELLKITYHGYEKSATIAGFINYAASESSLNFK